MRPPRRLPPRPSPQEITRQCMDQITNYQWGVIYNTQRNAEWAMSCYDRLPPAERDCRKRDG